MSKSIRHHSRLVTFAGKIIDRLSYRYLILLIVLVITSSAIYFYKTQECQAGGARCELSFQDALYFSIITFSSLGYGDIVPTGNGRIVVSIEVLLGLILTALFIGRIASERQSAMIRLLYTSENQKRLVQFTQEVDELKTQLETVHQSLTTEEEDFRSLSEDTNTFIASIRGYLIYQSNQGGLAHSGNASSLRKLYENLHQMTSLLITIIKSYNIDREAEESLQRALKELKIISVTMEKLHLKKDTKTKSILNKITRLIVSYEKWLENPSKDISEKMIIRILEKIPPQPWPKHFHKIIAKELGLSNQTVTKAIDILIKDGKITPPKNDKNNKA